MRFGSGFARGVDFREAQGAARLEFLPLAACLLLLFLLRRSTRLSTFARPVGEAILGNERRNSDNSPRHEHKNDGGYAAQINLTVWGYEPAFGHHKTRGVKRPCNGN